MPLNGNDKILNDERLILLRIIQSHDTVAALKLYHIITLFLRQGNEETARLLVTLWCYEKLKGKQIYLHVGRHFVH